MTGKEALRYVGSGLLFALAYGLISPNNRLSFSEPFVMVVPLLVAGCAALLVGWVAERRRKAKEPPRR